MKFTTLPPDIDNTQYPLPNGGLTTNYVQNAMTKKKLLLIVGPQGSGNHLYSKIFALHPDVLGWKDLNKTYWIVHDQEPFNKFWVDPTEWDTADFGEYTNLCVSISAPYVQNGVTLNPPFKGFIDGAQRNGWTVQVAIIGRDINILEAQQQRLRGKVTTPFMMEAIKEMEPLDPDYISHEMLCLYKQNYLKYLAKVMDFPIAHDDPMVDDILKDNSNAKYVSAVEKTELDRVVEKGLAATSKPGTEWYGRGQDE